MNAPLITVYFGTKKIIEIPLVCEEIYVANFLEKVLLRYAQIMVGNLGREKVRSDPELGVKPSDLRKASINFGDKPGSDCLEPRNA